jgi:hypothetical protein
MCLLLAIASTAVSAVGAVQQANAQKAQAEYNAAVARNNAIIADQNAVDIVQRGEVARDVQRRRIDQTIGAARAAIAGSGLLLDEGDGGTTSALLIDDLRTAGQFDIMTLKANIDREARRARIEGGQFQAQAGLFDLQASSISPMLAGAAAGFSRASSLYNIFAPSTPTFDGALGSSPRPQARPADLLG